MAENKKSFLLYADLLHTVSRLPDDKAGELFKLILSYVNDENPDLDSLDLVISIAFEPIRQQLKRDLDKWRGEVENRSDNGKLGNLKRWHSDLYKKVIKKEISANEAINIAKHRKASPPDSTQSPPIANIAVNDNVTVNDSVNVNDTVNEKKNIKTLLSQVDKSTLDHKDSNYYEIAISFMELFKSNLLELNLSTKTLESAKYKTWVDPIRLLIENDNRTVEEFREVFQFIKEDEFWKQQIRSTEKLRKKDKEGITYFETLLIKARNGERQKRSAENAKSGVSDEYRANLLRRLQGNGSAKEM